LDEKDLRIKELEYLNEIRTVYVARGFEGLCEHLGEQYKAQLRENEQLNKQLTSATKIAGMNGDVWIPHITPPKPQDAQFSDTTWRMAWDTVHRGTVTVLIVYNSGDGSVATHNLEVRYPGTPEAFNVEVLPVIQAAVTRAPTKQDLGDKAIPGISNDEMLAMLAELSWDEITLTEAEFNEKKRAMIKERSSRIQAGADEIKDPRPLEHFEGYFAQKIVPRTLKARDKRVAKSRSMAKKGGITIRQ
jgi:hypothetical protein